MTFFSKLFSVNSLGLILVMIMTVFFSNCRTNDEKQRWSPADSLRIVQETLAHRTEVDSFFRYDPNSPFHGDTSVQYKGIQWFPPDVNFCFTSKLLKYESPETFIVLGTKGEERKHLKYGYFLFEFGDRRYKLNVYKFTPSDSLRYRLYADQLSVWFTDKTTGKETYKVGRYVDIEKEATNLDFVYTINMNNAYNPYCAYSSLYSCAIPRKEDHFDFAVRAGEMKYHTSEHP